MSASSDKLRVRYPEFADLTEYPDATVDLFIGFAAAELQADIWGVFFEPGSLALAAHMLKCAKDSEAAAASGLGGAGPVLAVKTGDLSVNYGAPGIAVSGNADKGLLTTKYGLEYLRLSERVVASPFFIC